ncbi:GntR family transcriptional regulator [Saccharomonospora sp. NPDC046836]|uniref:GntR family transcriptional regulator n=1 Tax=Saccharomonospora sp. NPDC046836 TaxID=3156921 RepID=UPI0033DDEC18
MPQPHPPPTGKRLRSSELHAHLRGAILNGDLPPGERLVEVVIAETYSTSRTPAREALRTLEADGLVERTGRGYVVRSVSHTELEDMCEVREALAGMAGRLAAQRRLDLDLRTMTELADEISVAPDDQDPGKIENLCRELHQAIVRSSRNSYLAKQLRQLNASIDRGQAATAGSPGLTWPTSTSRWSRPSRPRITSARRAWRDDTPERSRQGD